MSHFAMVNTPLNSNSKRMIVTDDKTDYLEKLVTSKNYTISNITGEDRKYIN